MSEVLSDDSEANDNIRSRGNATRYTLFHGPVNTRLEMPSTGFEAEDTRSKYGHNDFPWTNFQVNPTICSPQPCDEEPRTSAASAAVLSTKWIQREFLKSLGKVSMSRSGPAASMRKMSLGSLDFPELHAALSESGTSVYSASGSSRSLFRSVALVPAQPPSPSEWLIKRGNADKDTGIGRGR